MHFDVCARVNARVSANTHTYTRTLINARTHTCICNKHTCTRTRTGTQTHTIEKKRAPCYLKPSRQRQAMQMFAWGLLAHSKLANFGSSGKKTRAVFSMVFFFGWLDHPYPSTHTAPSRLDAPWQQAVEKPNQLKKSQKDPCLPLEEARVNVNWKMIGR